jgi:membrane associated rhomboid family serine protease
MAEETDGPRLLRGSRQWFILFGAFVPIWVVVLLVGWIVIATLMPIQSPDMTRMAADEDPTIQDFMPAAGPSQ